MMNGKYLIPMLAGALLILSACSQIPSTLSPTPTMEVTRLIQQSPVVEPSPSKELAITPNVIAAILYFVPFNFEADPVIYTLPETPITTAEHVLQEVDFSFGQGGGMGRCSDWNLPTTELYLEDYGKVELEWVQPGWVYSCNWAPNEVIEFKAILETGDIIEMDSITALEDGTAIGSYSFPVNSPPGDHKIVLQGNSGVLEQPVRVKVPEIPMLYRLTTESDTLVLYNFSPKERIRFVVYKLEKDINWGTGVGDLWDIQGYSVNENGQLRIQFTENYPEEDYDFIVIGDISGEVHLYPSHPYSLRTMIYSPFGMSVLMPYEYSEGQIGSIWDRAAYKELFTPGMQTYEINVSSTDELLWGFNWCAVDAGTLKQISKGINLAFEIDGQRVNSDRIYSHGSTLSNGWACTKWIILLRDWKKGQTHSLDINYLLDTEVFDGATKYPAGEYQQSIKVTVE